MTITNFIHQRNFISGNNQQTVQFSFSSYSGSLVVWLVCAWLDKTLELKIKKLQTGQLKISSLVQFIFSRAQTKEFSAPWSFVYTLPPNNPFQNKQKLIHSIISERYTKRLFSASDVFCSSSRGGHQEKEENNLLVVHMRTKRRAWNIIIMRYNDTHRFPPFTHVHDPY